jgi:cytochrome c biogenesis protein CcmG/thiol:disulfide interchange protein DsbE
MKPIASKGFWFAASFLLVFGLVRVVLDVTASENEEPSEEAESSATTETAEEGAQSHDILGKPAPNFRLESVDGGKVSLSDFKGKVVVLDFWAVWCGPCQDSMPFFQKLQDEYGTKGLEVVGLHVDDRMPPREDVQQYLKEGNIRYRNLVSTTEVDDGFVIFAMPTTYLIDRKGVVRKRHIGFNPKTAPEKLEKDVRELLGLD